MSCFDIAREMSLSVGTYFLGRVTRDFFRIEIVEHAAEVVALAQDGDPRQPGLEAVKHQLLVQRPVIPLRHAPFLVVIGDIERVGAGPGAAGQAVGVHMIRAHDAALVSPGQGNVAQSGFTARSAMLPAISGVPSASASAIRSSRNSARPRPSAAEPIVPTVFSPAVTGRPGIGCTWS